MAELRSARSYQAQLIANVLRHHEAYLPAVGVTAEEDVTDLEKLSRGKPLHLVRIGNKVFTLSIDWMPTSMDSETGVQGEWQNVIAARCISHTHLNYEGNKLGGGCHIAELWHHKLVYAIRECSPKDTQKASAKVGADKTPERLKTCASAERELDSKR